MSWISPNAMTCGTCGSATTNVVTTFFGTPASRNNCSRASAQPVTLGECGMVTAFVAPNNFTFADSLLMLSIVILGGLGNVVGLIPAAIIVLVLPEKLQFIQEYRFLFYAALVIAILLFRPDGLLPRKTRLFFPRKDAQ